MKNCRTRGRGGAGPWWVFYKTNLFFSRSQNGSETGQDMNKFCTCNILTLCGSDCSPQLCNKFDEDYTWSTVNQFFLQQCFCVINIKMCFRNNILFVLLSACVTYEPMFLCVCQDPVYGKGKLAEIQGLILGMLDTFTYEQVNLCGHPFIHRHSSLSHKIDCCWSSVLMINWSSSVWTPLITGVLVGWCFETFRCVLTKCQAGKTSATSL